MAEPPSSSSEGNICPVCKKKPMNEHSFPEQQKCVAEAKDKGIPL